MSNEKPNGPNEEREQVAGEAILYAVSIYGNKNNTDTPFAWATIPFHGNIGMEFRRMLDQSGDFLGFTDALTGSIILVRKDEIVKMTFDKMKGAASKE